MIKRLKAGHRPDYFLMAAIFALSIFGLAMLASASSELGKIKFDDGFYYIKHQIFYGLSIGIVGLLFGYLIPYQRLKKIALPFLLIGLIALSLVFTDLGIEVRSSSRWVDL